MRFPNLGSFLHELKRRRDLVVVDAEAMGADLEEYGRVVLDGLQFEHDKATLKSSSLPALEQIEKFLKSRPDMDFFVVGHTDSKGSVSYNQTLSSRRAQAVVASLVNSHGIAASRLEAFGVGPLVPVFSNSSEAGKGKNRRVELVERPH